MASASRTLLPSGSRILKSGVYGLGFHTCSASQVARSQPPLYVSKAGKKGLGSRV